MIFRLHRPKAIARFVKKRVINLTATGGATYAWSGPAGFSSALATPSFIAQNNSGGQYNVIVTDQFGCKNIAFCNCYYQSKTNCYRQ